MADEKKKVDEAGAPATEQVERVGEAEKKPARKPAKKAKAEDVAEADA